jgi:sortase B
MKHKLYKLLSIALIFTALFSTYKYLIIKIKHSKIQTAYNRISSSNKKILELEDIEKLKTKYNNEDIVGLLKIEKEDFIEPLLQTDNNEYYLNHLIDKTSSILGSTFLDYRVNEDSKQITIYSHSSKEYDLPFNQLSKYLNENYFKKHKIIKLNYKGNEETYQIFSIYITDNDFEYLNYDNWLKHIENIKYNSIYKEELNIKEVDKLLVLQTCFNGNADGIYLIICGRKI